MNNNKKSNYKNALLFFIFLFLSIMIILLFLPKRTVIIDEKEEKETKYLACNNNNSGELNYPLANDIDFTNVLIETRVKFLDDSLEAISITISKKFEELALAKSFANKLEANYNVYVGEFSVSTKGLIPSYTSVDGIGKMTIYMPRNALNYTNAPLMVLGNETVTKKTILDYKTHYEKNGFSCFIE